MGKDLGGGIHSTWQLSDCQGTGKEEGGRAGPVSPVNCGLCYVH